MDVVGAAMMAPVSSKQFNFNASAGVAGLTYNINAPLTFTNGLASPNNNILLQGNGNAAFNLLGKITTVSGTVAKSGTIRNIVKTTVRKNLRAFM